MPFKLNCIKRRLLLSCVTIVVFNFLNIHRLSSPTANMIAKITILFTVLAAVHANGILYGHGHLVNTGVSARSQAQDAHGNYAFGYDIKDGKGASNSRSEAGDGHGNVKGSYSLADIDGRARKVEYVADGHGFRAVVKTNEPGTAASAPAAAAIVSPYAGPSDKIVSHVAPAHALVGHASYGAPLIAAAPLSYGGLIGNGAALGLGYGAGLGHGAVLGHGAAYGLGHGAAYGLGHGAVLGNGLVGVGHAGLGLGYGAGIAKGLYY